MKNLFFFIVTIILCCSSCKKAEITPTTYQIFNNSNLIVTNIESLDGSMYEVIVYHYSKNKIIQQDTIEELAVLGGKTGLMAVPPGAELFKVSFKFLPSKSPYYNAIWNTRYYLIEYKIIRIGANNIFGINGGLYISDTIVKKSLAPNF